jgi:two-component system, NtrC family, sensor kinase
LSFGPFTPQEAAVGQAALFPIRVDEPAGKSGGSALLSAEVQDMLRRNERLACIGLLAAGIAHEINNPAGSALLAAETALAIMDSPDSRPQVAACLRNIVTSMDRCGRIVRTLLRYSREEPSEKQACSINDVAKQALELARPYAERHGAELRLELDADLPLAPMNPLEVELVLVNLVRNAVEAKMEKEETGNEQAVVSIHTTRIEEGVRVVVGDNGCGMDQEQLAHVFDPFYTTRRQYGGSGLGMSIAHGIIQGHEGRMQVQSMQGMGTTVTIDLPTAAGP